MERKGQKPGAARPAARRVVTGEQVTIREWVEERDKVMAAEFKTHRAETKLDIANLAKEFGRELRNGLQAAQQEAKKARDDDRAEAKKARDDDRAEAKKARDDDRAEAKKARDDDRAARYADRAMARNGHLWTWGLIAAVGLGLAALIDGG